MRALVLIAVGIACAFGAPPRAYAHATLIACEPADGALLAQPPARLRLDFNEPVSPLVFRLVAPDGVPVELGDVAARDNAITVAAPPLSQEGTYVLSWRVVSADGHPVGGAVTFSIGQPSTVAPAIVPSDRARVVAIWLTKFALYLGLFVGVGGAGFRVLIAPHPPSGKGYAAAMALGLGAVPLSLALQGLDALALPLSDAWRPAVWKAGFATAYGCTAILAAGALVLGLLSVRTAGTAARTLAACAMAAIGLALAASGHASSAPPRWLTVPSVFLHGVCVAVWVGALLPLLLAVRSGKRAALDRFSAAIPLPLVILLATGGTLSLVQLDRFDALWTTGYGRVLSVKLAVVAVLLLLAATNRYVLAPHLARTGSAMLARVIAAELALAVTIVGLVGLWRFTPPPRTLAAAETTHIHFHAARAMAEIAVTPERGRGARFDLDITDETLRPVAADEVAVSIWNPAAGIEPLRRSATQTGSGQWRIEEFRVPVGGIWRMRADIVIGGFERVTIEDNVVLPRAP